MSSEHTFSFLHAADAHLDAPVGSASSVVRERVRAAQRAAVTAAVETAIAGRVDAILLAGDMLDGDTLRPATATWFPRELERALAAGIAIVAVTGNHDCSVAGLFPPGVHVVGGRTPEVVEIRRDGRLVGRVVAAGHEHAAEPTSLVAGFPTAVDDGIPTVGLVHAEVGGADAADGHHHYAPTTPGELDARGYAYWALGHIHRRQRLRTRTEAWYAGTLQGLDLGPGEVGPKGALLVEIDHGDVAVHPVDLASLTFRRLRVTLLPADRMDADVVARIAAELARSAGAATETVCRIELTGRTPLARELAADRLVEIADAVADAHGLVACEVRTADLGVVVPAALATDPVLLPGAAVELLRHLSASPDDLAALPVGSLAGAPADPADRAAYLASLLHGLEAELLSALVDGVAVEVAA